MKIYLIRHGQCNSNVKYIYNYKNEDINQKGIEEAEKLRKKIKDIDYDIVISSPLLRAKHTAEIINIKNKKVILDERIREREHGSLEGMPIESIDKEDFYNYYSTIKYGTEESFSDMLKRVTSFLSDLKNKDYNSVLIVAHSGISRAFYAYFNGIPKDGKFWDLGMKNTEIKEYEL